MRIERHDQASAECLSRPAAIRLIVVILSTALLAAAGRYGLMENDALALSCKEGPGSFWCGPWQALPQLFAANRLGIASLLVGAVAFAFRGRWLAWLGLVTGTAGVILYCFDDSAVGGLLALLTLAVPRAPSLGHQQA